VRVGGDRKRYTPAPTPCEGPAGCLAITPSHVFRTRSRRPNIEHYPDGPDPPRDHGPVCRFVGAGIRGPGGLWPLARGLWPLASPQTPGPGLGVYDEKGGA
jgi:hypothetical protein